MRKLPPMNQYQQLLHSALALVEEADLVAIFRAARSHPDRNRCIDLVNKELDKGISLMEAFDAPSALYEVFTDDWPELRVILLDERTITVEFGTNGPPSSILSWQAVMQETGVVEKLEFVGQHYPEGLPDLGEGPKGWNPLMGLGPE